MRIFVIAVLVMTGITGCAESKFTLSPDSRLPLWFPIPKDETPSDYTVSLTYYVGPSGREAILELKKKDSWWVEKKSKESNEASIL